jgi:hypothetical protein
MFSHGADSAHNASAGGVGVSAGGLTLPARFMWPHGGKSVFVTGNFTRFATYPSPSRPLRATISPVITHCHSTFSLTSLYLLCNYCALGILDSSLPVTVSTVFLLLPCVVCATLYSFISNGKYTALLTYLLT